MAPLWAPCLLCSITDLFDHLGVTLESGINITSYCEDSGIEASFEICHDDDITLFQIESKKRYLMHTFMPFKVEFIIGEFHSDDFTGLMSLSKCRCIVEYNSNMTPIFWDFVH